MYGIPGNDAWIPAPEEVTGALSGAGSFDEELQMRIGFKSKHFTDACGNPAGGHTHSVGCMIGWQNGTLGRGEERIEPNGAFVEDVIDMVRDRILFYEDAQHGKFACVENRRALVCLSAALEALDERTKRREDVGTEGTHAEDAGNQAEQYNLYQGIKLVHAFRIREIQPAPSDDGDAAKLVGDDGYQRREVDGRWMRKHNPQVGGYWVRYPDGYESYSPASAFGAAYTLVAPGAAEFLVEPVNGATYPHTPREPENSDTHWPPKNPAF